MNVFLWASFALVALQIPLLLFAARAPRFDALVAVEAAGGIWALALMLLSQGFHRAAYTVLALVASVLVFAGSLVFVRFFEKELDP